MTRPVVMSVFGLALLRIKRQLHTRHSFLASYWEDYHCDSIVSALVDHGYVEVVGERERLRLTPRGHRRLAPEE